MSAKMYTIPEFKGIDQSKSENNLNPSYSPDACNMDTENGDLAVAKGFIKHVSSTFQILEQNREPVAMYVWRRKDFTNIIVGLYRVFADYSRVFFVQYSSEDNAWHDLGGNNLPVDMRPKCSFLEVELDGKAQLLITTGGASIGKWDGNTSN
ncbi:MAG TPA: hypothetical protein PKB13_01095, partial [Clostridia bacterium]|nr:hypothetical protein [Clostridia bacterium]